MSGREARMLLGLLLVAIGGTLAFVAAGISWGAPLETLLLIAGASLLAHGVILTW